MKTIAGCDVNIEALKKLFPSVVTEAKGKEGKVEHKIDFEKLRLLLGDDVADGPETYEFTWVGKRASQRDAAASINKTLRPCPDESVNWYSTKNLYIEGDNLEALKLLQASYMGKIKVIYIDPPYNTGNDFLYRDDYALSLDEYNEHNVNEEGLRFRKNTDSNGRFHSDWCSMMYARLLVCRSLLKENGSIFISIDDNEADNLIKICNEVFGEACFVANISWQRTYAPRNNSTGIPLEVEHLIVYSRTPNWSPNKLERTEEMNAIYKNPDNDKCPWTSDNPCAPGAKSHQGMVYAIQSPFTGELIYPAKGRCWCYAQEDVLNIMEEWADYEYRDINDSHTRAEICGVRDEDIRQGVCALMLKDSLEASRAHATLRYEKGAWPLYYFTKGGSGNIRRKTYLDKVDGRMPTNFWPYAETGHTDEAKKELMKIFDGLTTFDTPKPVRLLHRILSIATDKNDTILDFFSGSATTAHATILKNSEDNGDRRFILVQIPEAIDNPIYKTIPEIGKERIRRAGKIIKDNLLNQISILDKDLRGKGSSSELETAITLPGFASSSVDTLSEKSASILKEKESLNSIYHKLDTGFRVFKCTDSNMKDVYFRPSEYSQDLLSGLEDNIKDDRTGLDLIFDCMLRWGVELSMPVETIQVDGCTLYNVNDGDLVGCFDTNLNDAIIKAIAGLNPMRIVFRDSCFRDDSKKLNLFEQFKQLCNWSDEEVRNNIRVI